MYIYTLFNLHNMWTYIYMTSDGFVYLLFRVCVWVQQQQKLFDAAISVK